MIKPAITPEPSLASSGSPDRKPLISDRIRLFTPLPDSPPRRPRGLSRFIRRFRLPINDLDQAPGRSRRSLLTPLVPNATITFLENVHNSINPQKIDRRLHLASQMTGLTLLASSILAVLISIFVFSFYPRPILAGALASSIDADGPPPVTAVSAPSPEAITLSINRALAALDQFFLDSPRDEPASWPPRRPYAMIDRSQAQWHPLGTSQVVLVPCQNADGVPQTVAVIYDDGRWQVDERSAITPETTDWEDFAASPSSEPQLFRLLLSRDQTGAWTAFRPAGTLASVPVLTAEGSRVSDDLSDALAERGGASMAVDVFLQTDADRRLHVVGWTKDKWTL